MDDHMSCVSTTIMYEQKKYFNTMSQPTYNQKNGGKTGHGYIRSIQNCLHNWLFLEA